MPRFFLAICQVSFYFELFVDFLAELFIGILNNFQFTLDNIYMLLEYKYTNYISN
jgi:hypothetical protein